MIKSKYTRKLGKGTRNNQRRSQIQIWKEDAIDKKKEGEARYGIIQTNI